MCQVGRQTFNQLTNLLFIELCMEPASNRICGISVAERRWRKRMTLLWTRSAWTWCRIRYGWNILHSWNLCEYYVVVIFNTVGVVLLLQRALLLLLMSLDREQRLNQSWHSIGHFGDSLPSHSPDRYYQNRTTLQPSTITIIQAWTAIETYTWSKPSESKTCFTGLLCYLTTIWSRCGHFRQLYTKFNVDVY